MSLRSEGPNRGKGLGTAATAFGALWTMVLLIGLAAPADARAQDEANHPNEATSASGESTSVKVGTVGARLLLPLYLVDTTTSDGPTTFFAIRNESTDPVDVTIKYYTADAAYRPSAPPTPQFEQPTVTLARKATDTFNVKAFISQLDVDSDGFARGYIIFEATAGQGVLHGDYFQLDDGGNFASGSRLVNIDPESSGNDLCSRFSMRFLDSALLFDSGTTFTVWLQPADPFEGVAFAYSVYGLAGGDSKLDDVVLSSRFAFEISASALRSVVVPDEFGAIEFQFPFDTVGHVSAVMSASDRFSVGFEATCLDPI
ncbi:MAG: hypothetical protein AAF657_35760 [Acidobacteriota bacterium]